MIFKITYHWLFLLHLNTCKAFFVFLISEALISLSFCYYVFFSSLIIPKIRFAGEFFHYCDGKFLRFKSHFGFPDVQWPITATAITKRNTVNKENLTNKKVLLTYKSGLLSYKQDLLTYTKKDLLTNTKKTHGK